jgi:multiple sugar transport system substrate-binding protein
MKKFKGYYDKHYFTTKGVIKQNVNYRSTKGAMLFSIGSTGGVKYQFDDSTKFNVGVAPIPQADLTNPKLISQGPDFAFLNHNNEKRAEAIWKFFKLFTSTKYNTAWALASGYSPVRYSVLETEDYGEYANWEVKEEHTLDRLTALNANYATSVGDYQFTSAVFKGSSEARIQVGTIFAACVNAGANLDAQINNIFKTAVDNTKLKM